MGEPVGVRESVFALHLGALYSFSTKSLLETARSSINSGGGTSHSARCLLPNRATAVLQPPCSNNNNESSSRDKHQPKRSSENPCGRSVSAAAGGPPEQGSGQVIEVFCRSLPLSRMPAASPVLRTATATADSTDADGVVDALREALGLIYGGVHVVHSPHQSPVGATASPETGDADDGNNPERQAPPPLLEPCTRLHAGLAPLYSSLMRSDDKAFVMFACLPFRLTALTQLCRAKRGVPGTGRRRDRNSVDLVVRFVFYQLLRAVDFLHTKGITVGNLSSSSILLTENLWVQIAPSIPLLLGRQKQHQQQQALSRPPQASPRRSPGDDLPLTYRWVKGMVSNLEYLLAVNAAAGRVVGDRSCHPIVPWVCDLLHRVTEEEEAAARDGGGGEGTGWRDLTKTKFRLKKGDAQLDRSYLEGQPPHHVPESLSELTLTVYLARRLPLQVLKDVVRRELVVEEYPKSLARMYSWTPDECVPEFYTDPGVFRSAHGDAGGLPDLEVPPWCNGSAEEFIRYHRSLLEGKTVSRSLHRWLDVTFGYCLTGQAAVDNKNVPLLPGGEARADVTSGSGAEGFTLSGTSHPGFVQLFRHPHPPRNRNAYTAAMTGAAAAGGASAARRKDPPSRPSLEDIAGAGPTADFSPLSNTAAAAAAAAVAAKERGAPTEEGSIEGVRSAATGPHGDSDSAGKSIREGIGTGSPTDAIMAERAGLESEGCGGGASIFGVAFDDYIGEEGVRSPPDAAEATAAVAAAAAAAKGAESVGAAGEARAKVEEDRRAFAFAHDVGLRLEPWYGRPRTRFGGTAAVTAPASEDVATPIATAAAARRGGYGSGSDGVRSSEAADLLALGCVLAEMCAGEPVLAGPSASSEKATSRGGGGDAWLEAAVELPLALRNTIGALTHADPAKRPSAHTLLSTTEPALHHIDAAPSCSVRSTRTGRGGWPEPPPEPPSSAYRGLFPPYMRDVYAFLAAVHQEETPHKRLVLAAATLPVLQVPIHAFSLAVPHVVSLLGDNPLPDTETEKTGVGDVVPARAPTRADTEASGTHQGKRDATISAEEGERERSEERSEGPTAASAETGPLSPATSAERAVTGVAHLDESSPVSAEKSSQLVAEVSKSSSPSLRPVAVVTQSFHVEGGNTHPPKVAAAAAAAAAAEAEIVEEAAGAQAETEAEASRTKAAEAAKHVRAWVSVFDLSAARLGPGLTLEVLLPPVMACLEGVRTPQHACHLMDADIWGVVARRVGNEAFLRRALPLLMAWLERGVPTETDGTPRCRATKTAAAAAAAAVAGEQVAEEGADHTTPRVREEGRRDGVTLAPERFPPRSRASGDVTTSEGSGRAILSSRDAPGRRGDDGVCEPDMPFEGGEDFSASRVQVAASACVSQDIFECLGPTLAARYLIPALVDCLGRLVNTAAASTRDAFRSDTAATPESDVTWGETIKNDLAAPRPPPPPPRLAGAAAERGCPPPPQDRCGGGDPASLALLGFCLTRGATEDYPDPGVSGGTPFLVLSRALGDICVHISSEEVTVPLVLSRVFHQVLPSLAPVLAQRGGPSATATGFRSVLEVTSLLGQLLPTLCPETMSHFYVGLRPATASSPPSFPADVTGTEAAAVVPQAVAEHHSVPWLLLAMPLPQPVFQEAGGLDSNFSTDRSSDPSTIRRSPCRQEDGFLRPTTGDGGGSVHVDGVRNHPEFSGGPTGGAAEGVCDDTDVSTRFVCQVETARLLATTTMGVLGDGDWEEEGREECSRVLQAAEAFFAAFGRLYRGLSSSSPTMMAALKLAKELHTPLASLFGFDVMRRRVPSASGRAVPWLTDSLVHARRDPPQQQQRRQALAAVLREGFGAGEEASAFALAELRQVVREGEGDTAAGAAVAVVVGSGGLKSSRKARQQLVGARGADRDGSVFSSWEFGEEDALDYGHGAPQDDLFVVTDGGMYISPAESPEHPYSPGHFGSGSTAVQVVSGVADRIQQAIKQRLVADGGGEGGGGGGVSPSAKRLAGWIQSGWRTASSGGTAAASPSSGAHRNRRRRQRTAGGGGGATESSTGQGAVAGRGIGGGGQPRSSPRRGVPAWGHASEKLDPLLPPPLSALPSASSSHRGRGNAAAAGGDGGNGSLRRQHREMQREGRDGRAGRSRSREARTATPGAGDGGGSKSEEHSLEWPSLLGALGSRAPSPTARSDSSQHPRAAAAAAAAPVSFAGTPGDNDRDDGGAARIRRETAEATATAIATGAEDRTLSSSPPQSPPLFRGTSPTRSLSAPARSPAAAAAAAAPLVSSDPPPPPPGTCWGVGVEVAPRLRERGWLTGTRGWGDSGQRRGRELAQGFQPDSVGSMFSLDMSLQTSFFGHEAAVTSMAVEKRSESLLLTGSAEGEVRVWSLRDHPVSHVSGFRPGGGNDGSGGGGGGGSGKDARFAVTQLGIFEGSGRAAALDGLVRVWDVERSQGLAVCHQGANKGAPPLTAFSLSGCGEGTTPPLDDSEWDEVSPGESGCFSAPDDQQLTASYGGGVVHFDCRQGRSGGTVQDLFPVAQWDVDARLQSLLALPSSKGQSRGDHRHGSSSRRNGDAAPLPVGLCTVCEGEGSWVAAGSGAGNVVVFDKRRPGGRPLFWWNAHGGVVVGVFHVARNLLLTMSRDRTAVLWDLSRSPGEGSGIDSTGTRPALLRHPSWGVGAYSSGGQGSGLTGGGEGAYGEASPARVSTAFGLPDAAPGLSPATVLMLPLPPPPAPPSNRLAGARISLFGESFSASGRAGRLQREKLPVLFAASGDRMVASVVRREPDAREREEEVHPARFLGPAGKAVKGKKGSVGGGGGRRSASGAGGLVVRSIAVLPLRRLSLLGCADGWVRVGT